MSLNSSLGRLLSHLLVVSAVVMGVLLVAPQTTSARSSSITCADIGCSGPGACPPQTTDCVGGLCSCTCYDEVEPIGQLECNPLPN